MLKLAPKESRKLLDAMGVSVVVLRHCLDNGDDVTTVGAGNSRETSLLVDEQRNPKIQRSTTTEPSLSVKGAIADLGSELTDSSNPSSRFPLSAEVVTEGVIAFSLVSMVTKDTLILCELPEWSGRLLDGRMTGVLSDLLRILSSSYELADWQYFHWPIEGISKDVSAATDAVEAWFNRRWAETETADPTIMVSVQSVDLSEIVPEAIFLAELELLMTSVEYKKIAWIQMRATQHV